MREREGGRDGLPRMETRELRKRSGDPTRKAEKLQPHRLIHARSRPSSSNFRRFPVVYVPQLTQVTCIHRCFSTWLLKEVASETSSHKNALIAADFAYAITGPIEIRETNSGEKEIGTPGDLSLL